MAIVAILMGLLLPSLQQARQQANRVACQSNLRQISVGVMLYAHDHDGHPPVAAPAWAERAAGQGA